MIIISAETKQGALKMQILKKITPEVIQATTAMLSPYIPEISPTALIKALADYQTSGIADTAKSFERPLTREETGEILGLSMPTINRLLNRGILRRIKISRKAVRVDPGSVRELLENGNEMPLQQEG